MKTLKLTFCILWVVFIVPLNVVAQNKDVPITTSSKEALNLFIKGRDKLENSEAIAATALLDQAIQKDPNFAMAFLYRSQSGGGFNVSRQYLDKAVNLKDKVSEGEKNEILYYQAQADGNEEKEKEYLDLLLKNFPSDKRIQTQVGIYFYGIKDYLKAIDHFTKAAKLDKNYVPVFNMIGYCQSALENYKEAEKAFQTCIKLTPNKANPYDSHAELLLKMGKYDESIAQYKMAFEKDPVNLAGSLAGVGHNYIFEGDYISARKYYKEYYDKSTMPGGKLTALYWKAVSYLYEGKPDDAVKVFDEYRELAQKKKLSANLMMSYANQGLILTETGNPKEGMKYYEKATDEIGKSKFSKIEMEKYITYSILWRFYTLTAKGDFDKATVEAEKAVQKIKSTNKGDEMFLNSLLAYSAFKKGNYDEAIQYYSKADREDPMNWYYNAMAYNKKGDKKNATKLLEKITKLNVNSLNLALVRNRAMEELKK